MKKILKPLPLLLIFATPLLNSAIALASVNPKPLISAVNISAVNSLDNNLEQLYQAGQKAFTQGNYAEAVTNWQKAVSISRQQGDRLSESVILANLSIAYRELSHWQEAKTAIASSLELARSLQPVTAEVQRAIAQALDTKANLAFIQGQNDDALQTWQEAQILHQKINDEPAKIRNLINQARAFQRIGLFTRSRQILAITNDAIVLLPDSLTKAKLLHHMGNILQTIGEIDNSEAYLQKSFQILEKLEDSPTIRSQKSEILLDLGHLSLAKLSDINNKSNLAKPIDFYTRSAAIAIHPITQVNAQLSLAQLLIAAKRTKGLNLLLLQIQTNIDLLPITRNGIENRIRYAEILGKQAKREAAAVLLSQAIAQAKFLDDRRTQIYALGTLGHLYEQNQQFPDAIALTRQAIVLAISNNTDDLTYQWHWQLGRLLKATDKSEEALISYNQAVEVLKSIQGDLSASASIAQFSFQESVEPLYREYVGLLLETSDSNNQKKLKQAQAVIESLKVSELVNFFRSDCLKTRSNDVTQIDKNAALIYTISLGDRLEVLLTLPNGNIKRYKTLISAMEIETNAIEFINNLRDFYSQDYLEQSQKIYNWVIRPLEAELINNKIQTIVIVSDQSLRNIPFASLHDGKQFLIEKYNLAISPGLQLLDSKPIAKQKVNAILAGLSESRFSFSPLPSVKQELESIQKQVGNTSTDILLNETFTSQNLQNSLQALSFPVVHIATHGQFSSKAADTFIVAWDRKVNIEQLNGILRSRDRSDNEPLELLILSACQTASGDKRSALGLAGIAVRAGARSTIGSLWQISDEATAILMSALYTNLGDRDISRAEALRSAQLTLLKNEKFNHPYYWSPFILLGNWQ